MDLDAHMVELRQLKKRVEELEKGGGQGQAGPSLLPLMGKMEALAARVEALEAGKDTTNYDRNLGELKASSETGGLSLDSTQASS